MIRDLGNMTYKARLKEMPLYNLEKRGEKSVTIFKYLKGV